MTLPRVSPTWLDRAIQSVAPAWGMRRMRARVQMAAYSSSVTGGEGGGYEGASSKRSLRAWDASPAGPNAITRGSAGLLRHRARDLVRNSPIASAALHTKRNSVVGTGLVPQPRVDREALGVSDAEADTFERAAADIISEWSRRADVARRQTFGGLQRLAYTTAVVSGDAFALRRFKERDGDVLGVRVQLIEPERVTNPQWRPDTGDLMGGVEIDADGEPVAYHVLDHHPGEIHYLTQPHWTRVPALGQASGLTQVLHLYHQERPEQVRGVSALAPIIEPLKQLSRYTEAEIQAAIISSFFTVFVRTETEQGIDGLFGDSSQPDPTGRGTAGQEVDRANDIRLAPGAVMNLGEEERIDIANPQRPNQAFDGFVAAMLRQVAGALDLPYEVLVRNFTASYSASRAALEMAWQGFRLERQWLIEQFCQPIYEWVIWEAVARERLHAPGFLRDPLIRQAWLGTEWVGPSRINLDPNREMSAAERAVKLRVTTRQRIAREYYGSDWDAVERQLSKEDERIASDNGDPDVAVSSPRVTSNGAGEDHDSEDTEGLPAPGEDP